MESGRLLVLSGTMEAGYWASPAALERKLSSDVVGLVFGIVLQLTQAGVMQLTSGWAMLHQTGVQITLSMLVLQLAWLLCHRRSYARWTYQLSLLQRVRALLVPINYQLKLSTEQIFWPIRMHVAHVGSWRALAAVVTYMQSPVFLSIVIHACNFRHQLLLLSLAVAQHAVLGIPHQLRALDLYGLRPKVADLCASLHVLLDPTFPGQAAGSVPWQCSEATAGFTLMFLYLATCCLIPLCFAYHFERRHKLQWLRSVGLRSLGDGAARDRCAASRAMQGWAACALAWSLLTLGHAGLRHLGLL